MSSRGLLSVIEGGLQLTAFGREHLLNADSSHKNTAGYNVLCRSHDRRSNESSLSLGERSRVALLLNAGCKREERAASAPANPAPSVATPRLRPLSRCLRIRRRRLRPRCPLRPAAEPPRYRASPAAGASAPGPANAPDASWVKKSTMRHNRQSQNSAAAVPEVKAPT